ncbi:hypothetical protein ACVWWQ_001801 [Rhodanobacter sp. TND4EL1]
MQEYKPGASVPQQTKQPTPVASAAPVPAHPADSGVSYVMQAAKAAPAGAAPDFLGGWGPAGLAFFGVIVTLVVKWIFDAKKRRFDAKRKLYLDVADALHDGAALFGSFGNMQLQLTEIMNRFDSVIKRLSKAEVVAGNDLLRALANLKNFGGGKFGEFLNERMKAEKPTMDIQINVPLHQQLQADIEWCLAEQRRLNVEGPHDQAGYQRFQRVQNQFNQSQQRRQELIDKDKASHDQIMAAVLKLAEMSTVFSREVIPLRVEALSQMREELDFAFDAGAYRSLQEDMATKAANMIENTAKATKDVFEDKSSTGE